MDNLSMLEEYLEYLELQPDRDGSPPNIIQLTPYNPIGKRELAAGACEVDNDVLYYGPAPLGTSKTYYGQFPAGSKARIPLLVVSGGTEPGAVPTYGITPDDPACH